MSECVGSGLARFFELRGLRVFENRGILWHSVGCGMYMSLPYHRPVELSPSEARDVVRSLGVAGIRYPSLLWPGLDSGLYVCRQRDYSISTLHRNFRAHVKRGLPLCEVRPVTVEELLTQAPAMNEKAMRRQRRYDPELCEPARWRRFVKAAAQSPCIEVVGAFVDGRLAAYDVNCMEDGCLMILYRVTDLEHDACHPSHVLDFHVTRRLVTDPSVSAVSMGWAPLIPHPGHHEYKLRLGYQLEPMSSVIRLNPILERTLCSRVGRSAVKWAGDLRSSQWFGMARAVVEGAAITRKYEASQQRARAMSVKDAGPEPMPNNPARVHAADQRHGSF